MVNSGETSSAPTRTTSSFVNPANRWRPWRLGIDPLGGDNGADEPQILDEIDIGPGDDHSSVSSTTMTHDFGGDDGEAPPPPPSSRRGVFRQPSAATMMNDGASISTISHATYRTDVMLIMQGVAGGFLALNGPGADEASTQAPHFPSRGDATNDQQCQSRQLSMVHSGPQHLRHPSMIRQDSGCLPLPANASPTLRREVSFGDAIFSEFFGNHGTSDGLARNWPSGRRFGQLGYRWKAYLWGLLFATLLLAASVNFVWKNRPNQRGAPAAATGTEEALPSKETLSMQSVTPAPWLLAEEEVSTEDDLADQPPSAQPSLDASLSSPTTEELDWYTFVLDTLEEFDSESLALAVADESSPSGLALAWLLEVEIETREPMRVAQRYAMASLYFHTNGPKWRHSQGWLSADDECTWFNQELFPCTQRGHLIYLDLSSNQLGGRIPSELSLLSSLLILRLANNQLVGTLPESIVHNVSQLYEVNLSGNQLHGSVTVDNWKWLESLSMAGNEDLEGTLTDVSTNWPFLRFLNLSFTTLSIEGVCSVEYVAADCSTECVCCTVCCNMETSSCQSTDRDLV